MNQLTHLILSSFKIYMCLNLIIEQGYVSMTRMLFFSFLLYYKRPVKKVSTIISFVNLYEVMNKIFFFLTMLNSSLFSKSINHAIV